MMYYGWTKEAVIENSFGNMVLARCDDFTPTEKATWIAASLMRWNDDNGLGKADTELYAEAVQIVGDR